MRMTNKLQDLQQELESLANIERLFEYTANQGDDCGCRAREERRTAILAEIAKIKAERPWFEAHAGALSVVLLVCVATACATLVFVR